MLRHHCARAVEGFLKSVQPWSGQSNQMCSCAETMEEILPAPHCTETYLAPLCHIGLLALFQHAYKV